MCTMQLAPFQILLYPFGPVSLPQVSLSAVGGSDRRSCSTAELP
uniref:Uncharacterized protein n=1 Tax=Anguilla anguilla TaxID=7936 RepID=A0A0E9QCZ6_ANGAN